MKLTAPIQRNRRRGIATLTVIVLMAIIASLAAANSGALSRLKREIDLIDRRQLQKYSLPLPEQADDEKSP